MYLFFSGTDANCVEHSEFRHWLCIFCVLILRFVIVLAKWKYNTIETDIGHQQELIICSCVSVTVAGCCCCARKTKIQNPDMSLEHSVLFVLIAVRVICSKRLFIHLCMAKNDGNVGEIVVFVILQPLKPNAFEMYIIHSWIEHWRWHEYLIVFVFFLFQFGSVRARGCGRDK